MVRTPINKTLLLLLLIGWVTVSGAVADKVLLKDGSVEESVRVWETDRYVHFILKGTRSVEIRYAKEIVDHIEGADGTIHAIAAKPPDSGMASAPVSPEPPASATTKDTEPPKETKSVMEIGRAHV